MEALHCHINETIHLFFTSTVQHFALFGGLEEMRRLLGMRNIEKKDKSFTFFERVFV